MGGLLAAAAFAGVATALSTSGNGRVRVHVGPALPAATAGRLEKLQHAGEPSNAA
jgi:hypothetical protein